MKHRTLKSHWSVVILSEAIERRERPLHSAFNTQVIPLVRDLFSRSSIVSSIALAIFLLNFLLLAGAQESQTGAHSCSIAGTVVKEPGSQPLKKVLVQVFAENQKEGANYIASTDSEGRFRIEKVMPGRYRLFVERTGFVGVNERGLKSDTNVFTVQTGQSVDDLLLRMMLTAVISGRVTDEDGDPMSGVRVFALRKVPGKTKREALGAEATNDLGEYRLSGLFPGQYWVVATPAPDFRDYEQEKSAPGDDPGDPRIDTRYLTTYYPGTYDGSEAIPLTLKAGDEMPVNLTMVPGRTYRVRGIVTGIKAGEKPIVELVSKAGDSVHSNEAGPDGRFEMRGVGPGSYLLRVSSGSDTQPLSARQEINVVSADVEGLKLAPQPAFAISGHVHVEGGAAGGLDQYSVNLRSAELSEGPGLFLLKEFFGANAQVDRLGNFEWKEVNLGTYIVQLFGADRQSNCFLKSVTLGGRDVSTGFTASGKAMLDLDVSCNGGSIQGMVSEKEKDVDDGHPVSNATVVAVPEEKYRNLPDRFGTGETDQQGHFTLRGLAPGSYTLYAWRDVEENVYRDADFLRSEEANGTSLKVEEGSHQQVTLKLSPVGADWQ